jgi:hypothetical protein
MDQSPKFDHIQDCMRWGRNVIPLTRPIVLGVPIRRPDEQNSLNHDLFTPRHVAASP